MSNSLPFTQHRDYSDVNNNTRTKCVEEVDLVVPGPPTPPVIVDVPPPQLLILGTGAYGSGNEQSFPSSTGENKPIYVYIDILSKAGQHGTLTFNRLKLFMYQPTKTLSKLRAAVYKLTPAATFGDLTTYDNSVLIVESDDMNITNLAIDNFIDITFSTDTTLTSFTGATENHYFLALNSDENLAFKLVSPFPDGPLYGWSYRSNTVQPGGFSPTMATTLTIDNPYMPYYLFWKAL